MCARRGSFPPCSKSLDPVNLRFLTRGRPVHVLQPGQNSHVLLLSAAEKRSRQSESAFCALLLLLLLLRLADSKWS